MSYLVSYGTTQLKIARPSVLMGVFVAAVIATILYPVFGSLADRWGRKTTYLLGAVLMLASIVPGFALINTGDAFAFGTALVLIFGIAMAPAGGVTGSLFSMIFTPEVRYSGASIGYTISQVCGAAFAPLIATALYAINGSSGPVVIYLLIVCAISVVSVLLLPGKVGKADPLTSPQRGHRRLTDLRSTRLTTNRGRPCPPCSPPACTRSASRCSSSRCRSRHRAPPTSSCRSRPATSCPNLKNVLATYAEWFPYLPLPQLPGDLRTRLRRSGHRGRRPGPRHQGR